MTKNFWKRVAVTACCGLAIAACGDQSGAPQGSTVVITGDQVTYDFDVTSPVAFGDLKIFQAKVLGPNGFPINDVDILIDVPSGCQMYLGGDVTVSGGVVVNGAGVPQAPLVDTVPSKVDEFGEAKFGIECLGGAGIVADYPIDVWSGAAFGRGSYVVECIDGDTTNPPECP
jgi:hypothetical protein